MAKTYCVCAFVAFVLIGCGGGDETAPVRTSLEDKAAEGRAKMHQQSVAKHIADIRSSSKSATAKVAAACEKVSLDELPTELRIRCASAHLAVARSEYRKGFADEGNAAVRRAEAEGASKRDVAALAELKQAAEARTAKREKEIQKAAGAVMRAALANELRQHYLDNDLDIKVSVSGKENQHIELRFALFNDVWANKLRKGDLLSNLTEAGFTRLDLNDGYDYHVYWNLQK
ncbi:MAG TPA: hypothetical protein VFN10_02375 [Thermoanaerobaculia bacterium]|nr:hypothetical protein [Thermoanaerobaculia bacterium]